LPHAPTLPDPVRAHRASAPSSVACFVATSSESRTEANDEGGRLLREGLLGAGHRLVGYRIVPDDPSALRQLVEVDAPAASAQALLITGGTGLGPRDRTLEAVAPLFTRELPGFGEIFRALSFAEIGSAAMLSRAAAGTVGSLLVFTLPGSPAAVRLALERLILPELGHAIGLLQRG
jgi:molybdenum cofactor biosynthesis protein B